MRYKNAELRDVLSFRERKSFIQEGMNKEGLTTVALSLNVPGPEKRSKRLDYLFRRSVEALEELLSENRVNILKRDMIAEYGGETLILAVEGDPGKIKDMVMSLELAEPVGRFLDCDVNRPDGTKVSRVERGFPSRKCYLCGNDAKVCGRSRAHTVEELFSFMNREIDGWMREETADRITEAARSSLTEELMTNPKPGLVDPSSSGAHEDMNEETFLKSIDAIVPHIRDMCLRAYDTEDTDSLHDGLREEGLETEKDMYAATGGVNTHKGAIFTLGVLSAAAVRTFKEDKVSPMDLRTELGKVLGPFRKELLEIREPRTNGEKAYLKVHGSGIRGEVETCYGSIFETGLPALTEAAEAGLSPNDIKLFCLISLMAVTEDSNILKRSGKEGLEKVKRDAQKLRNIELFRKGEHIDILKRLDAEYSRLGISGGGSGDLLAASLFVYMLFGE